MSEKTIGFGQGSVRSDQHVLPRLLPTSSDTSWWHTSSNGGLHEKFTVIQAFLSASWSDILACMYIYVYKSTINIPADTVIVWYSNLSQDPNIHLCKLHHWKYPDTYGEQSCCMFWWTCNWGCHSARHEEPQDVGAQLVQLSGGHLGRWFTHWYREQHPLYKGNFPGFTGQDIL